MFGLSNGCRWDRRLIGTPSPELAHASWCPAPVRASLRSCFRNSRILHAPPPKACRSVKKTDMLHNDYLPVMQIDAQTYEVGADGQLLTCEPATVLPMAQRYFLF